MRISDWSSDVCSSDLLSLQQDIDAGRAALDSASRQLVERGLAIWSADSEHRPVLIVRGQANLIDESAAEHLDRVRQLLDELEDKEEIRSEEHTSELQSLMRISYAVFCLKKKHTHTNINL